MSPLQGFLACQHNSNSSRSTNIERRPRTTTDDVKLLFFQGNGTEDPEQYWFLCEVVWTIKQVQGNDIKKGQLAMTFRGWVLDWYMKFVQVPTGYL